MEDIFFKDTQTNELKYAYLWLWKGEAGKITSVSLLLGGTPRTLPSLTGSSY